METNDTARTASLRTLYFFPILHSRADLGGLEAKVAIRAIEKLGREQWEAQCRSIEQGWSRIEEIIENLKLPYERCRIYQDGLPVCGEELKIVSDLARSGSRNHRLLLALVEKGATLMGTESLQLLLEEYRLLKDYLANGEGIDRQEMERKAAELLQQRDAFIADRIDTTLGKGECGLLFLGMLHSVQKLLPPDIHVVSPIVSLLAPERARGQAHD
jgi:hypothetical protein